MPDGFDVRPEQLRRGAADLRADAEGLGDAALGVAGALEDVPAAAGAGPLAGAAAELAAQLDRALRAIGGDLTECADSLEATGGQYLAGDAGSASTLDDVLRPHVDGPR